MIQRAPAHVGERRNLDAALFEEARYLVKAHQVIERIVKRAQVWVDLLCQVSRQETQPLACFHRRPGQHDALDMVALVGIDGGGNGKVSLAGSGRADAEGDVVLLNLPQVLHLMGRASVQVGFARQQTGGGLRHPIVVSQLDQTQLNVIDGKRHDRQRVKVLQSRRRESRLCQAAIDAAMFATP